MTPDDDNDGVEVWRIKWRNPQEQSFHHYLDQQRSANVIGSEPGRWFTTLRAEQLLAGERWLPERVRERNEALNTCDYLRAENARLRAALATLPSGTPE